MRLISSAQLPTRHGAFVLHIFADGNEVEHVALVKGAPIDGCLVRVHSECVTGDIFGSMRCDCRDQLEASLQLIDDAGEGLLIYMRGHEGRGIGLANKVRAYALQEQGVDTVDANIRLGFAADARNYDAAVGIIRHLDLIEVRLLTNNHSKIIALEQGGINVIERVPIWTSTNPHNAGYIATMLKRMGHLAPATKRAIPC